MYYSDRWHVSYFGKLLLLKIQNGFFLIKETLPGTISTISHGRAPMSRRIIINPGTQIVIQPCLYFAIQGCGENELDILLVVRTDRINRSIMPFKSVLPGPTRRIPDLDCLVIPTCYYTQLLVRVRECYVVYTTGVSIYLSDSIPKGGTKDKESTMERSHTFMWKYGISI